LYYLAVTKIDARKEATGSVELLQWSVSSIGPEVIVAVEGELDLANADALGEVLQQVVDEKPVRVAVDLANLSFLDSTGIRCLVAAARAAAKVGCELVVRNPSGMVARVLELCGVDKILLDDSGGDASGGR
jgi:anti-sigma B factor antagonist